jgi:AcrR family transcriptional regulator
MSAVRVRLSATDRRQLIIAAAAHVFASRRYDEVSTAELAQACGVSRGLLSHYFATKRDLYLAVVATWLEAPKLPVPAFVEGATAEDRIVASVHDWLHLVTRGRDAWLAVSGVLAETHDAQIQDVLATFIEQMIDQICEIAGLHAVREEPQVRLALHGYAALATSVTRRWLLRQEIARPQLEALLADTLVDLVRRSIPVAMSEGTGVDPAGAD